MSEVRTIYKYVIGLESKQFVDMPEGAQILTAQVQHERICIWAMIDLGNRPTSRRIVVVGTGHAVPATQLTHIGTVQQGPYAWHVFEETK